MSGFKKEFIIPIVVVVGIIIVLLVGKLTEVKLSVGTGKASSGTENKIITSYKDFEDFAKTISLEPTMEIDLKKKDYSTYYNEEFFKNHNLAAVLTHEDNSKVYICGIDSLSYTDGKKKAIVTYTDKTDGYLGPLGKSWTNVMLVELDKKTEDVEFIKSSSTQEKK